MSGSVNKVILVGNVGNQPEIRISQSGGNEIANFSIATSERWKDKNSGEQKEKTDWHRVVVFAPEHRGADFFHHVCVGLHGERGVFPEDTFLVVIR